MERLAFISDDRYISEETRGDVKGSCRRELPGLESGFTFHHSIIYGNVAGYFALL